jgi:DNA-binding NtrC family response regulator
LFLDEIDSLSLAAQAKLLRLLQDRSYRPLGAERFGRADIRVLTATNRDLEREVRAGTFRRDLYFRINVLEIHMTPLRERPGDIPLLAEHFLDLCCGELGSPPKLLTTSAMQLLCSWEWPGNVRELYNVLRRAVVFADGSRILPAHLLPDADLPPEPGRAGNFRSARALAVQSFERRYVEDMLRRHAGNITRAAEEAGKDRRVFGRLVKRLKIDRTAVSGAPAGPGVGPRDPTPSS